MMPTRFALDLAGGGYRTDRDRLLKIIFAIEAGLADGTAPTHWADLLTTAHWMVKRDAEASPC